MLKIVVAVLLGMAVVVPALSREGGCTQIQSAAGLCPSATTTDTEVILETYGGTPGDSSDGGGAINSLWPDTTGPVDPFADCIYSLNSRCLVPVSPRGTDTQPITWADIVAFRPTPGSDSMEPRGWTVVGLHTNFYASSTQQIHEGTLLGQPAAVRFTPTAYRWNYGDGSSASLATAGASWAALATAEFDPTPTSHVYATSGNYSVTLTIDFAAEYRMSGLPWTPIAGTISVPANDLQVFARSARTVLVDRECTRAPRGPGC